MKSDHLQIIEMQPLAFSVFSFSADFVSFGQIVKATLWC